MSRTDANSTSPRTQLKALRGCVSGLGRNLCSWVSRIASSLLVSRKRNGFYLLYTEHTGKTGLRNIQAVLDTRFPGYTIELKALGRDEGKSENSLIIHLLTHDKDAVGSAAARICQMNKQKTVLCIELPVTSAEFVAARPKNKSGRKRAGMTRPHRDHLARTNRTRVLARLLSTARFVAGRIRS